MSRINAKLGLKPAGKRSMMKLPDDRTLRNQLTSAKCPACERRGAILSTGRGRAGDFVCTWCYHTWTPA
jgi:DNA-directed RNA polymerase subunit M/transcription elongation factor TFIIS